MQHKASSVPPFSTKACLGTISENEKLKGGLAVEQQKKTAVRIEKEPPCLGRHKLPLWSCLSSSSSSCLLDPPLLFRCHCLGSVLLAPRAARISSYVLVVMPSPTAYPGARSATGKAIRVFAESAPRDFWLSSSSHLRSSEQLTATLSKTPYQ